MMTHLKYVKYVLLATTLSFGLADASNAATIRAAVGATASSTFPGFPITDTINQSGLSTPYVSGVTDFDAYLATNPMHTPTASGFEWFSASNVTTPIVTYDLGSSFNIDRIALWNEEFSGFGQAVISVSTDGIAFSLLTTINPTDSPQGLSYPAQVFSFADTLARYFMLQLSGCPQEPSAGHNGCGIGEIAFSNAAINPVPLPAALPLFATILAGGGLITWRRKRKAAKLAA